ncbi:MAG TPA: hypothetical protein VLH38_01855 [Patescibacteria group bacterium]|nr:hypothetical protein [Patescibacteria group bacterium]
MNHAEVHISPEVAVDVLALAGIAVSNWVAKLKSRAAAEEQYVKNSIGKLWPADKRAKSRAADYRVRRATGKMPELVTYELNA